VRVPELRFVEQITALDELLLLLVIQFLPSQKSSIVRRCSMRTHLSSLGYASGRRHYDGFPIK